MRSSAVGQRFFESWFAAGRTRFGFFSTDHRSAGDHHGHPVSGSVGRLLFQESVHHPGPARQAFQPVPRVCARIANHRP